MTPVAGTDPRSIMRTRSVVASVTAVAAAAITTAALVVPGTEAAATRTVKVDDYRFSPAAITVRPNTKVRWVWVGSASHDVESVGGTNDFGSKIMRKGSYSRTFKKKGLYRIDCSLHSSVMKMTVRVK